MVHFRPREWFSYLYTHREQVCTANNKQACVHRRFSFANEQRRKENADEEGFGVFRKETRTIHRNSSGTNGTFERKRRKEREEKSVSCLPVSLESELYFVITGALSRSLLAFPLISFSTKAETETLKKKHVSRACETPTRAPNVSTLVFLSDTIVIS